MKYTSLILLTFVTCGWANALPIEQWSYNLKASERQIAHANLTKKILNARNACISKAEIGEKLAIKKLGGTPLNDVLQDIVKTHSGSANEKLPWYMILEMQRLARDAYREDYNSTDDIDNFVLALYHTCLSNEE